MRYWEILFIRIIAYVLFALLVFGGWRIVNAQTAFTCRGVGTQVVCTPNPTVPSNSSPGFDPSVIGHVADGAQLSPEALRYLRMRACIKNGVKAGLSDDEIRARCFR